jgi:iron complex transport system ATP-binding protein
MVHAGQGFEFLMLSPFFTFHFSFFISDDVMKEELFVECKGVSIGYHERSSASVVVKRDLSIKAMGGEMVALIGGNGIGKSTLLKTIAGFQTPLGGELLIRQRPASAYSSEELAREMSFVSTEIVRVANLSVREMVGLGRFPYTGWLGQLGEADHQIVEEAIQQVGLSGYENRPINRISDGDRQRAMIARALAQDTSIIVLDEPTAFLDISNKYEIVRILHKLADEQGKCIIYSTHDLNTALSKSDRIWLMLEDKVVEGIPEEISTKGYLSELFPNNHHLYFDADKGDFSIRKEKKGIVNLSAVGPQLLLASKALERLGFEVIPVYPSNRPSVSPSPGLPVSQSPGLPVSQSPSLPVSQSPPVSGLVIGVSQTASGWLLCNGDRTMEAGSLEQLCLMVKRIKPEP